MQKQSTNYPNNSSSGDSPILPELIIADVLARWPQTVPVFIQHRMSCVGCAMAPFETLSDAAGIYGLALDRLMDALNTCVRSDSQGIEND